MINIVENFKTKVVMKRLMFFNLTEKQKKKFNQVSEIIKENYHIEERIAALEAKNYPVKTRCMGSGGIYQLQEFNGEIHMQIGYNIINRGKNTHNYYITL